MLVHLIRNDGAVANGVRLTQLDAYMREHPMERVQKQLESYSVKNDMMKYKNRNTNKLKRNREELEYSQAVYGIAPVLNSLKSNRREILELRMQSGLTCKDRKDKVAYSRIQQV